MANMFHVTVVSADQQLFNGDVQALVATAQTGEIGVLAGHTPLIANLKAGQVRLTLADGSEQVLYVSGGILEVQAKQTIVLADDAARAEALNEENIRKAQELAQERLKDKNLSRSDYDQAEAILLQTVAQLAALRRKNKR